MISLDSYVSLPQENPQPSITYTIPRGNTESSWSPMIQFIACCIQRTCEELTLVSRLVTT